MKAILHIGTGKTGSTSIQEYMFVNRKSLLEQGIFYSEALGLKNHRRLPAIFQNDDKPENYYKDRGLLTPKDRRAAKEIWWREFQNELMQAGSCARCLISAEHLSQLDNEEVKALHNRLAPLFEEVRVLVYLRDPVDYAVSMYDTALKIGSPNMRPAAPALGGPTDYARILQAWSEVFGKEHMNVRLFDRSELVGGDILQDFAHTAEIETEGFASVDVKNPSLGILGQELLLQINRRLPKYRKDGRPNKIRGDIATVLERFLSIGPRRVPDQDLIAAYGSTYAASNEWVRANFFPDRTRLFPEKHYNQPATLPLNEEEMGRLADLVVDIWKRARMSP